MKLLLPTIIGLFVFGYILTQSMEFIRNGEPIIANKHLNECPQILDNYCDNGITDLVDKEIKPNRSITVINYSTHNLTIPSVHNRLPLLKNSTCYLGDAIVEKSVCAFASN